MSRRLSRILPSPAPWPPPSTLSSDMLTSIVTPGPIWRSIWTGEPWKESSAGPAGSGSGYGGWSVRVPEKT